MNTPEPCDKCKHLYYNALCKDDPFYEAECKFELEMGNSKCLKFLHYRSQNEHTLSFGNILRKCIK
jgi:hypothetical protein